MTKLLIIRHGNTFDADETPRRVGARTDIPLVQSGVEQARVVGEYLKQNNLVPDMTVASALIRAQETATIMMYSAGADKSIQTDTRFNEIDHGDDENQTDGEIIARIGKKSLEDWDDFNVVPDGWDVDPRAIQAAWIDLANECVEHRQGQTTCVVSSGGIIRFAPIILPDAALPDRQSPKVKTASMSLMEYDGHSWTCHFWNKRPE